MKQKQKRQRTSKEQKKPPRGCFWGKCPRNFSLLTGTLVLVFAGLLFIALAYFFALRDSSSIDSQPFVSPISEEAFDFSKMEKAETQSLKNQQGYQDCPTCQENKGKNLGIANPASKNCVAKGGEIDIRTGKDGRQTGYCVFKDGRECEEWAFFRGECK